MSDNEDEPSILNNEEIEEIEDDDIDIDIEINSDQELNHEINEGNIDSDGDISEEDLEEEVKISNKSFTTIGGALPYNDDDNVSGYQDNLEKITHRDEFIMFHPETKHHNFDEIYNASIVTRNSNNIIIDKLHTTIPILTKYEYTKIIGQRIKQLNEDAQPFISLEREIIDNNIIAEEELKQKKMPFIIQRPLPNGAFEYWHIKDLELL
jgi:DNA-directed RNA polymerase subunit K/omega